MNQPRCVLLAALALAALLVVPATAQRIDVSANLLYDDPNSEAAGGTFTLVAKTNDDLGISAISAYLAGITGLGNDIAFTAGLNHMGILPQTPPREAVMEFSSGVVNAVYGQDMTSALGGVGISDGTGAGAGYLITDPLHNPNWDGSTAILTGTFGATAPSFTTEGTNSTDGNVFTDLAGPLAGPVTEFTTTVRGDGVSTYGLLPGDANRDWTVDGSDFALLGANWQQAGGWNQGDFNSSGTVDGSDFALLGANWQQSATPPSVAVAGVPEPAGIALLGLGLAFAAMMRRRLG